MKKNRFLSLVALSLATALTLSCGEGGIGDVFKDWLGTDSFIGQFTNIGSNNLLQNNRLGFMSTEDGVPDGQVDVIEDVQISGAALAGGTTIITVKSREELKELYLQIEGESGFYQWVLEPEDFIGMDGSNYVYQIYLEFNQNQDFNSDEDVEIVEGVPTTTRTFTVSGKTASGQVADPKNDDLIVKQVSTGALQVSLSWDKLDDVDLYVYTPYGDMLFFGNRASENSAGGSGKLDVDSNAGCNIIDGTNSENIFFDEPLQDGKYIVVAHLYKKCTSGDGARFNVTVNGKLVTEKGQKFADEANGQGSSLGGSAPTSSSTNVKLIGTAVVANGEYVNFIAAN